MRVPIRWLKEFVDFDLPPDEVAKLFISKGLEAESIFRAGENLAGVVVGEIVSAPDKNPGVSIGAERLTVRAESPRPAPGSRVAVALPGFEIVPGKKIVHAAVLCESDLGLSDSTAPILLPEDWKTGAPLLDYLDDYVLELRPPSNRGDLLGMVGIARELATYLGTPMKVVDQPLQESELPIDGLVNLEVADQELCPRYVARLMTDVAVGTSPFPLRWRIAACGFRPVNAIVDITNLILLERGQPLHAFDYDRFDGKKVIVRRARAGEQIRTLDGDLRKLNTDTLVIADGRRPVAIAGIMGGKDTEVSASTRSVLLESACFGAAVTRRAAQKLKLVTEASRRFEMGVDIGMTDTASKAACALLSGYGKLAKGSLEIYQPQPRLRVELSVAKTSRLLGVGIDAATVKGYLTALGFDLAISNKGFSVGVPSFRQDITCDAELVEEIARLYGYERIPSPFVLKGSGPGGPHPLALRLSQLRELLVNYGFTEIRTLSFLPERLFEAPGVHKILKPQNPLSERIAVMRPNLIIGGLEVAALNCRRSNPDLRVFEIGKVFAAGKPPKETLSLAGLVLGQAFPHFWQERPRPVTFFDIKGVVEMLCGHLGLDEVLFRSWEGDAWIDSGAKICAGSETFGFVGAVSEPLAAEFDLEERPFVFELDLDRLFDFVPKYRVYTPLPKFPPVLRDLSLVARVETEAAEIEKVIRKAAGALLERISIFDYFSGKSLPAGKKSIGVRLVIRSEERTLASSEVERIMGRVVSRLSEQLGIELRKKGG